jgi:hypothetical protein
VQLYIHSPYTPSWRGAQLKHRENFTFYLFYLFTSALHVVMYLTVTASIVFVVHMQFRHWVVNLSLHHRAQMSSGAHPASYPLGTRALSLGVKWPRREADHSPPSSAVVKNALSSTYTPPVRLYGVVLS